MKKISTKIFILALSMMLITGLALSTVSIIQTSKSCKSTSASQLKSISQQDTSEVDKILSGVESKVENVVYAINLRKDAEKIINKDTVYFSAFEKEINEQAISQLGDISGLLTAYVRYDPQLTYGTSGLFYTRGTDGKMTSTVPTDLLMYDKSDKEHVGWFYEPLENKKATWMEPYYNANLDKTIISYVIPFYINNTGFGIVGIDFDFDTILDIINDNNIYETGYVAMLDSDYNFFYHPEYENGENLTTVEDGAYTDLKNAMTENDKGFYEGKINHKTVEIGYSTMSNGWKICIVPTSRELSSNLTQTITGFIIAFLIALGITIVVTYFFTKRIAKPIKELTVVSKSIADGKLDQNIRINSKDEIGQLAKALEQLTKRLKLYITYIDEISASLDNFGKGNLTFELEQDYKGEFSLLKDSLLKATDTFRKTIGNIIDISSQLSASSSQVSASSQHMAQGAVDQAMSVDELATTIKKISADIMENANNANDATQYIENLGSFAELSREKMNGMISAIEEISDKSSEIKKINKTIEDIAFQTNILSLNAAVEAARAGAAGKGFAVVADEVRNLATKSSAAAKDTSKLIGETITAVDNGSDIANETKNALQDVIDGVTKSIGLVSTISEESNKQSTSLSGALNELQQVNGIVQTNSATAEESSAVSEELYKQAQTLENHSKQFKI